MKRKKRVNKKSLPEPGRLTEGGLPPKDLSVVSLTKFNIKSSRNKKRDSWIHGIPEGFER